MGALVECVKEVLDRLRKCGLFFAAVRQDQAQDVRLHDVQTIVIDSKLALDVANDGVEKANGVAHSLDAVGLESCSHFIGSIAQVGK